MTYLLRSSLTLSGAKRASALLLACLAWLGFVISAAAAPGDVESLHANIVGSSVLASAVQPDGKTIIGGNFTSVLDQPRNHIARLNADGTLDAGFNPNANSTVRSVAVQADGRILLGGCQHQLALRRRLVAEAMLRCTRI